LPQNRLYTNLDYDCDWFGARTGFGPGALTAAGLCRGSHLPPSISYSLVRVSSEHLITCAFSLNEPYVVVNRKHCGALASRSRTLSQSNVHRLNVRTSVRQSTRMDPGCAPWPVCLEPMPLKAIQSCSVSARRQQRQQRRMERTRKRSTWASRSGHC